MIVLLTETLKAIRIHGNSTAYVFLTREGTPYRDISTAFTTAVQRVGIRDFMFTICGILLRRAL
jgi:hypothetical protein